VNPQGASATVSDGVCQMTFPLRTQDPGPPVKDNNDMQSLVQDLGNQGDFEFTACFVTGWMARVKEETSPGVAFHARIGMFIGWAGGGGVSAKAKFFTIHDDGSGPYRVVDVVGARVRWEHWRHAQRAPNGCRSYLPPLESCWRDVHLLLQRDRS
jgi:hypothetical protein